MEDRNILSLPIETDDFEGEVSMGYYLAALLEEVLTEGESFNAKRPFGNSGWEWDVLGFVREHDMSLGGLIDCVKDALMEGKG